MDMIFTSLLLAFLVLLSVAGTFEDHRVSVDGPCSSDVLALVGMLVYFVELT